MGVLGRFFKAHDGGPSDVFSGLRERALRIRPTDLGLPTDEASPVFGVLMETGRPGGCATFVCLGDGTVSLYTSAGGGVIGAGEHEAVRTACLEALAWTNSFAREFMAAANLTKKFPLPKSGAVYFYLLALGGVYLARCREDELQEQQDPFANLYLVCHHVLARAREATEKSMDEGGA